MSFGELIRPDFPFFLGTETAAFMEVIKITQPSGTLWFPACRYSTLSLIFVPLSSFIQQPSAALDTKGFPFICC